MVEGTKQKRVERVASVHEFLNNYSTYLYHIQYYVYRSNHYAHGIIALYRMGATDSQLDRFTKIYLPMLDDAAKFKLPQKEEVNLEDFKGKLIGKEPGYNLVRDWYVDKLKKEYKGDLTECIRKEFPNLSDGLSSAAFHGTIHIGYGYSVGNELIVCEGLAYLYNAYHPLRVSDEKSLHDVSKPENPASLAEVLARAKSNRDMQAEIANVKIGPEMGGRFVPKLNALLDNHGDTLLSLVKLLEIPEPDAEKLRIFLFNAALTAYTAASFRNDFFLLHGVTSAWALHEILPILDSEEAVKIVQVHLCALIATYLVQGAPELDLSFLEDPRADFEWPTVLERAMEGEMDEHVLKLVQACYDMAMDHPEHEQLYKAGALVPLENEYHMSPEESK